MWKNAKIYNDGSHYIAIPKKPNQSYRPRKKKKPKKDNSAVEPSSPAPVSVPENIKENAYEERDIKLDAPEKIIQHKTVEEWTVCNSPPNMPEIKDKKQIFEELYEQNKGLKLKKRRREIIKKMEQEFANEFNVKRFVEENIQRKKRNLICRRIRLMRKVNLQEFNYFVTFTYDDKKHTEDSFRKKLAQCICNLSKRKNWKYIGVWERSPEKKRLHFHGIFYIPNGTMPGEMEKLEDYNTTAHMRQITVQNTYFGNKFGRCDFKKIESVQGKGEAVKYILKYIEKSGEKIVYSKRLPQFFISDVMDDDVICYMGEMNEKLILSDTFKCWEDGMYIGQVSKETIQKLKHLN